MKYKLISPAKYFLLISFLIFSCANPYIGKILPEGNYPDVSKSFRHLVVREHLIMDYECIVNTAEMKITFDGDVQIRKEGFSGGWEVADL